MPAQTPESPRTPTKNYREDSQTSATSARDDGSLSLFLFLLAALAALITMALAWPEIYEWMKSGPPQPVVVTPLGEVQQIHYIGGLGRDTQIDLKNQSVLVMGAAALQNGVELELRTQGRQAHVCITQTQRCWTRLGH